jgi:hypothetical protein
MLPGRDGVVLPCPGGRHRQQQGEHRWRDARQHQPPLLGLDQPAGQRQADAVPVPAVGLLGEQHALVVLDAGTLVADVDRHGARGLADDDRDRSPAVRAGVVDQHAQHLADRRARRPRLRGVGVDPHVQVAAVQCQAGTPLR